MIHSFIDPVNAEGLAPSAVLVIYLRNIANGAWNAGRKEGDYMTASEYAQEALKVAGLWE